MFHLEDKEEKEEEEEESVLDKEVMMMPTIVPHQIFHLLLKDKPKNIIWS